MKTSPNRSRPLKTPIVPPPGWAQLRPHIERRLRLGFTIGDLAGAMAVDHSFVSRLERGAAPTTSAMLERYKVGLDELVAATKSAGGAQ